MTEIHLHLNDLLRLIRDKKVRIENPDGYGYDLVLHDKLPFPGD